MSTLSEHNLLSMANSDDESAGSSINDEPKGAITKSKIKHAIKHKTSPARHAPLLQPSLGRPER